MLSLLEKMEVLDHVDKAMRIAAVTQHYGVNKAANCSTMIIADENRGHIKASVPVR
jgi:hypothetical protein